MIIKQENQNMKIKFVFGTALYVTISESYTDKFRCRVPLIFQIPYTQDFMDKCSQQANKGLYSNPCHMTDQ